MAPSPIPTAEVTSKLRVEMARIPLIVLFSTDEISSTLRAPRNSFREKESRSRSIRPIGIDIHADTDEWKSWKTAVRLIERDWLVGDDTRVRLGWRSSGGAQALAGGLDHPIITVPRQDKYAVSKF